MTSVAETGHGAGLRGRLAWIALAISLTLNVFFVGGLVWSKLAMEQAPQTPAQRFEELAGRLNLNTDQHAAFQQFVLVVRSRGRLMRESNEPLVQHVWDEYAKPDPDQTAIASLIDRVAANRQSYQKETSAALVTFLAALGPEQRATFIDLTKRRHDGAARRIRWLIGQ